MSIARIGRGHRGACAARRQMFDRVPDDLCKSLAVDLLIDLTDVQQRAVDVPQHEGQFGFSHS